MESKDILESRLERQMLGDRKFFDCTGHQTKYYCYPNFERHGPDSMNGLHRLDRIFTFTVVAQP
eukprot:214435-Pelagomonas_calceolata.AAC.3